MKIIISAIGKIASTSPEAILMNEYIKRINWDIKIHEIELKKKLLGIQAKEAEGEALLASLQPEFKIILLDEAGDLMTSQEFASFIKKSQINSNKLAFIIGGASGHSDKIKAKSDKIISLSPLTFPHMIARLLLVEQIYRAFTIINAHPYHK